MDAIEALTREAVEINHQIATGNQIAELYKQKGDTLHLDTLNATLEHLKQQYRHKMDAINLLFDMEEAAENEIVIGDTLQVAV